MYEVAPPRLDACYAVRAGVIVYRAVCSLLVLVLALSGVVAPAWAACCMSKGLPPEAEPPRAGNDCCGCGGQRACCAAPTRDEESGRRDDKAPPERPVELPPLAPATPVAAQVTPDTSGATKPCEPFDGPGFFTSGVGLRRHLQLAILTD